VNFAAMRRQILKSIYRGSVHGSSFSSSSFSTVVFVFSTVNESCISRSTLISCNFFGYCCRRCC
jgi:hypothetical protein